MALITVPDSVKVIRSSFRLQVSVAESESPFSYQQQTYDWGGSRWEGEVTIRPYGFAGSADIRAFLAKLKGRANTFLYSDPDYLALGNRGSYAGTIVVNGGSQTGTSLVCDGATPSATGVARAGDYIQLGTGASSELYMVVDDADADVSGNVTFELNRALLSIPGDNAPVVNTNARGVFKLSENIVEWNSNFSSIVDITIPFKEAL